VNEAKHFILKDGLALKENMEERILNHD